MYMRFRLNFFKILRLIVIIAFIIYAFSIGKQFLKEKNKNTEKVTKTFDIRKDDFHNSENKGKKTENTQTDIKAVNPPVTQTQTVESTNGTTETPNDTNKTDEQKTGTASQQQAEKEAKEKADALKKAEEQKKKDLEAQKIQNDLLAQKNKEIEADKKAREEAAKKVKENTAQKMTNKKFLQVATLQTEEAAKKVAAQLGGNFSVQAIKGTSGKTMYRVISSSTDNAQTLSAMEAQVKSKFGASYKYIVRTAGK